MKQFSPTGMATKGFYGGSGEGSPNGYPGGGSQAGGGRSGWINPKTFGNPDGAAAGGGAWKKGGDNPNGPTQAGGPGGGGGGTFGLQANSISSSCPSNYLALPNLPGPLSPFGGIPCGCFNDYSFPFDPITTALTPALPIINGNPLLVFALVTNSPNIVTICLSGTLPQNTWTSMSVDGIWGETYVAAAATQFDNTTWAAFGITIWVFDTALDPFSPFLFFTPFTVTWT